ncbi:Hypothetical predicted protein [Cloeon dipterum]|uniref:Secreted protein n=1 Tax=Cloeon dipterum TaxID=197152 RepID=A0A8S1D4L2_9INSE|nr:Hypothetical predicted protein [Cloeon dipterum]
MRKMRCLLGAQYPLAILLLANAFSATNLRDKATPDVHVPSGVRQARAPLFFPLPVRGYTRAFIGLMDIMATTAM